VQMETVQMVTRNDKAEDHRNDGKHYAGLLSRGEYNKRKAHVEDTVDMQVRSQARIDAWIGVTCCAKAWGVVPRSFSAKP
jgi:hypothetical protein